MSTARAGVTVLATRSDHIEYRILMCRPPLGYDASQGRIGSGAPSAKCRSAILEHQMDREVLAWCCASRRGQCVAVDTGGQTSKAKEKPSEAEIRETARGVRVGCGEWRVNCDLGFKGWVGVDARQRAARWVRNPIKGGSKYSRPPSPSYPGAPSEPWTRQKEGRGA